MTRRRVLIALTIALLLGGFVWFVLVSSGPPEPSYQGKSLTAWLALYQSSPTNSPSTWDRQEADAALQHMGTNAIPTLLRYLRAKDSKAKNFLVRFALNLHLMKTPPPTAAMLNTRGGLGFQALGMSGWFALPELIKILDENISQTSQSATCYVIGRFGVAGADAVPSIIRVATNGPMPLRASAINVLGSIHARPELAVPALQKGLDDADQVVVMLSMNALPDFGMDAAPAVPRMVAEFAKNSSLYLVMAEMTLKKFGSPARQSTVVPALTPLLRHEDPQVRARTAKLLGEFGRDAVSALPALRELLNDADYRVRTRARSAVEALEPEAAIGK